MLNPVKANIGGGAPHPPRARDLHLGKQRLFCLEALCAFSTSSHLAALLRRGRPGQPGRRRRLRPRRHVAAFLPSSDPPGHPLPLHGGQGRVGGEELSHLRF